MSDQGLLLGFDVGTTCLKALLVDSEGTEVGVSVVATPFQPRVERVEMEVEALRDALHLVLEGLGDARRQVAAVAITGMAECGAPLDGQDRALAPVIAWHDPRGAEAVATLERRFGDEVPRRIGQRLRTVSSVAKLGWLASHGVVGVCRWLGVPELCLFTLTGAQVTDYSLAARTGCYDITARQWWPEVPATLGIAVGVFPTVAAAGTVLGLTSASSSSSSGLPAGIPVTLAGHDHLAALAGSGAGPGDHGNSVGTAESVVVATTALPDLDRALALRVAVTLQPSGDGWAALAGAARAGRAIEAVSDALGLSPSELDDEVAGAEAAGPEAAGAGTVDLRDLLESVAQGRRPALPPGPPGRVWDALLRALSERTWEAVGRATALVGPPSRLVVFGGGSHSRPWLEAKADVGAHAGAGVGLGVWRSGAGEAAARGAALYAGTAAGWWSSPAQAPRPALEEIGAGGGAQGPQDVRP
ncbi:MAG: FGGY family carbohydrate kinase [Actinomycetota bacterium]|nr:FGGY family carbohydrate kinase [Actinomycetota bacterium]